jgi:deoxyribodipyrimidine photolyase
MGKQLASPSQPAGPLGALSAAAGSSASARYSSSFSAKISPWLAMGCLSPRHMYHALRQQLPAQQPAGGSSTGGGSAGAGSSAGGQPGLTWLQFELLWRDFFRFITKRYAASGTGKAAAAAVAPAQPALATA